MKRAMLKYPSLPSGIPPPPERTQPLTIPAYRFYTQPGAGDSSLRNIKNITNF